MSLASSTGFRSPARSNAASPSPVPPPPPRPTFDAELLKNYTKALLSTTLHSALWPDAKERETVKGWMKEIGDRVKARMLEIQPTGFKYIVLTQINENLGQGGRSVHSRAYTL
ncbi:hypothetical protein GGX14DRAFT_415188, partial [Mycena pura]